MLHSLARVQSEADWTGCFSMETLSSIRAAAGAKREKKSRPPPPPPPPPPPSGEDSVSLPSYRDYPAHRPFSNALMLRTPQKCTHHSHRSSSPCKAFPETSSASILSALRNLQEKLWRLELAKGQAELSLCSAMREDAAHTLLRREEVTNKLINDQMDRERAMSGQSESNQVLITHLAAAKSRCVKLERQLDEMRRLLRNARTEKSSLRQQASVKKTHSGYQQSNTVCRHVQLEKLEQLEQEYLRLTRTQSDAEVKICQLEMKLEEEEHQRKLVQDKAKWLQTGMEANRILLRSVSPCPPMRPSKGKSNSKKSSPKQQSCTEPHYRLSLRDVPFVTGTSVSPSHSVRANVQSVLSLLKQHQPHLCNSRVLSHNANRSGAGHHWHSGSFSSSSSSSSSSAAAGGEALSELLQALQEELQHMTLEQDELMWQLQDSVSARERKALQREQDRLLLKIERKGEQISKINKHKSQIRKLRREAKSRQSGGNGMRVSTAGRRHSAEAAKVKPGEMSKRNLRLLRDMKALQTSLWT